MRRKSDELIPLEIAILEAAVALRRRGSETFHGFAIAKDMKTQANRRTLTAHGTLYRALHRLERAGLIEGLWEEAVLAENEGRPRRRLYRLGALAELALGRAHARARGTERAIVLRPGFGTRGAK
jgi:DNA-binding PadR family transcriptional regulator